MNTPGSVVWLCMRTRSPRIAPPLNGLRRIDREHADLEAVGAQARRRAASVSVDFPAPGAPVIPTDHASPGVRVQPAHDRARAVAALLDEREQLGDRDPVAGERALDERVGVGGHAMPS